MKAQLSLLLCGCLAVAPYAAFAQDQVEPQELVPPLDEAVRTTSADTLQRVLYDLVALKHDTHQAHWNVVGSDFYQLHEFYSELYTGLEPYIDLTAERIRVLGPAADARLAATAEASTIPSIDTGELSGTEANTALAERWRTMSNTLYDGLETVSDDPPTQDLLIGITRFVDVSLWKLRAHLTEAQ